MAASDGPYGNDPDTAASAYAEMLAAQARSEHHAGVPAFDILLLGMGGEGHTASIFPESPAVYEDERMVVPVRNCPKPPPTRISLTIPAIRRAKEVWVLTTGEAKADAVALALSGAGEVQIPVAGARGQVRTRWLLDKAAASKLSRVYQPPQA
jgi:6-phosphogluconolactonase